MPKQKSQKMSYKDKQDVLGKLDYEGGYDYFNGGSDFSEYKDPEFRKLVKAYQDATESLHQFLGELEVDYEEE